MWRVPADTRVSELDRTRAQASCKRARQATRVAVRQATRVAARQATRVAVLTHLGGDGLFL